MRTARWAAVLLGGIVGCGGSHQPAATAGHAQSESGPGSPAETPATEAPGPAEVAQPAAPRGPADETLPAGLSPLSDEEAEEAEKSCTAMQKPLADAVRKVLRPGGSKVDATLEVLANPPQVAGVNVARCAELLRRDIETFRARSMESDAIRTLKIMQQGILQALEREPSTLCPSAPPTPSDLNSLRQGSAAVAVEAWEQPGWKCLRFNSGPIPVSHQYELRTDAAKGTYEIIARGFPVRGGGVEELIQSGSLEGRQLRPSGPVMRK